MDQLKYRRSHKVHYESYVSALNSAHYNKVSQGSQNSVRLFCKDVYSLSYDSMNGVFNK